MKTQLLVTGASGFVGRHLIQQLQGSTDYQVRALVRRLPDALASDVEYVVLPDFSAVSPEHPALQGVDVVVHLASRVHVMNDTEADPLAAFRRVNVGHTLALARSAASAGARRFVFVSSVKVNGEQTAPGRPFRETDLSAPVDPYGVSKMEAEEALKALALEAGLEVVIIRPVLVYGPGVKANFESMMKWLVKRVPLPFGAIRNQRSLVALDNLVSLILTCTTHPAASNETFWRVTGRTCRLLNCYANLHNPSAHLPGLYRFHNGCWSGGATLLGKKALSQRLCGSLQVDITKAREVLGWQPPMTLKQGLDVTAQHYFSERTE